MLKGKVGRHARFPSEVLKSLKGKPGQGAPWKKQTMPELTQKCSMITKFRQHYSCRSMTSQLRGCALTPRRVVAGEVNGKAGNLNNAMSVIYASRGTPAQLGAHDVLAVFDCDQVCSADFFMQTLPLMARSGDVAMVTPS